MVAVLEVTSMKAYVSISKWFPKTDSGEFRTVNSVFEELKGTPLEVGRNTLRLALDGRLDRGHFDNQVKLARLCSLWSGNVVTVDDLMNVEEDK